MVLYLFNYSESMKICSFILPLLFCAFLYSHEQDVRGPERWVNVTGVGEAVAAPDLAVLRLGVVSTAKSAKLATELNNASILKIFGVLDKLGLEKKDFETDSFQLIPQRQYRKGLPPLISSYQVTNSLMVRIRDLEMVGEIMQSAIEAGGNNFQSLTYTVKDNSLYIEEARVLAVENALQKAEELAEPLGAEVGAALTIQELSGHYRPMQERRMMQPMQADAMMESVPVQGPSELKTEVRVQVKFALE